MADPFQRLVAGLDYPMAIVTVPGSGCLVGFTTQVSIDPARFLVGISKTNHTHEPAMTASTVVVHLLDRDDHELARVFGELSGDDVDKLSLVAWSPGPDGVPVLDGTASWFAGTVLERIDLGDHTGLLLDVVDAEVRRWGGQLGFQSVRDLHAAHDP